MNAGSLFVKEINKIWLMSLGQRLKTFVSLLISPFFYNGGG
ncbi:hypothetical protein QH294_2208 [Enterococcus faecalis]|nr:hypothetical protein QH294_2208 [Enterococcus faecalis]